MKKTYLILIVLCSCNLQYAWSVGSGGYTNQVVGTKALGMGNAFVATADDPSAIYFNPAGLTQLNQVNISVGDAIFKGQTDYTSTSGEIGQLEDKYIHVPNFYVSVPFHKQLVFGFGINSPFGLETKWFDPDNNTLKYVATDSSLQLINFNPTLAYMVNNQISIGAGLVYGRASATLENRTNQTVINTFLNGGTPSFSPDGKQKLTGDGDGWGYNFGFLLKPKDKHSIGLSYRSEIKTKLKGNLELSNLDGTFKTLLGGNDNYKADAETEIKFPATFIVGYAYKPGKWTLEADGEWANYSTVDNTNVTVKESDPIKSGLVSTNPINRDWHNSWNLGLGANYEFNKTWQARGGYFYYPNVIPTYTWEPGNPESSRNGFTLGGSFTQPAFIVDLAYNLIIFNDRTITNSVGASSLSTVNGNYETTAHILSANFTYKFR